jgi:hypothetical protein
MGKLTLKFLTEFALTVGCAFTWLATLMWPDWIELAFGVAPDNDSGFLEAAIAISTFIATVGFIILARAEWRRVRSAGALPASFKS